MSVALATADGEIEQLKVALADLATSGAGVRQPTSAQHEVAKSDADTRLSASPQKLRDDAALVRGELEQRLWTAFQTVDSDHSGALSKRELYKALGMAGVTGSHAQLLHIFQAADANHDGTVDWCAAASRAHGLWVTARPCLSRPP